MNVSEFVRNFENAVENVEPDSLTPETQYQKIKQWDSLGLLCLLAMIDCEYQVQVPGMALKQCETLQDVYELVCSRKLAEAA
jgi:acyl carrier protein